MTIEEARIQVINYRKGKLEEYKCANFAMETASEIQVSDCNGNCRAEYK